MTAGVIVVAPQEFKGSLTAIGAASAMADGLRRVWPAAVLDVAPVADGGPGTVAALLAATGGELRQARCRDPLGRQMTASYGVIDGGSTAIIEMAAASGLVLLTAAERDARVTSTEGTGDLVLAALEGGAGRVIIGLGGSATNDGGSGMARALGIRLLDAAGAELPPGGAALARLDRIDAGSKDPRLAGLVVLGATDVRNPLCGPQGASAVFGPQKGATPADVAELDAALARFARIVQRDLGAGIGDVPGAGAAGGLGAGLVAFLGAELRSGFALVAEAAQLEERIARATLVITGEGRLDGQSGFGKTTAGVARLAARHGVPCVALCGGLEAGWEPLLDSGLTAAFSIMAGPATLPQAQAGAASLLAQAAEQVGRLFDAGRR